LRKLRTAQSGQRALSAALLCTALAAGATACGSSASSPGDALSGLSADQIASKALANLKTASTVHVAGPVSSSGQKFVLNMTLAHGRGCTGTMALQSKGSFRLLEIGKQLWIKPDDKFWKSFGGSSNPAVLSLLSGKYLKTTSGGSFASIGALCDPRQLAGAFRGSPSGLTKGATTTISGQQALKLEDQTHSASMYVSVTARPRILRIAGGGAGQLSFTAYDSPVQLTAPPAKETLDGSKYGF
jgi:hypothetical protein